LGLTRAGAPRAPGADPPLLSVEVLWCNCHYLYQLKLWHSRLADFHGCGWKHHFTTGFVLIVSKFCCFSSLVWNPYACVFPFLIVHVCENSSSYRCLPRKSPFFSIKLIDRYPMHFNFYLVLTVEDNRLLHHYRFRNDCYCHISPYIMVDHWLTTSVTLMTEYFRILSNVASLRGTTQLTSNDFFFFLNDVIL